MSRAKARLDERSMREFGQRVVKMVSTAPVRAGAQARSAGGEGRWHHTLYSRDRYRLD